MRRARHHRVACRRRATTDEVFSLIPSVASDKEQVHLGWRARALPAAEFAAGLLKQPLRCVRATLAVA